jgi:hypothetical protein
LAFEPLEDRRLLSNLLVTSNADDGSAGTLRAKIDQANSDGKNNIVDAIYFSTSLAGDQITLSQGALPLNAGAAVTIWDTDQSGNTVPITIKGAGTNLLQVASGAGLALNGLTFSNGNAASAYNYPPYAGRYGGAINNAGVLTLYKCSFVSNTAAGEGGAIYNTGTVQVTAPCTFTGNTAATCGGAIANGAHGVVTVVNSTFSNNTAADGGALYNGSDMYDAENMTLAGCTFSGNSAQGGGAIGNDWAGVMTVNTCTFNGNSATGTSSYPSVAIEGGGAILNSGALTVSASTIAGNSAAFAGGGIYNGTGNVIPNMEGGIQNDASLTFAAIDTIASGNTAQVYQSTGIPDVDGVVGYSSTDNLIGSSSPGLGPLAANGGPTETMALLSGSPALEAGGPITTLTNGIDNQVAQFQVDDAAYIASTALSWPIQIDGEQMTVTGVDLASKTLTVQRATAGSAAGHNAGAGVYFAYDQRGDAVTPPVPDIGACQTPPPSATSLSISVPPSEQAGSTFTVNIKAYYAPGKIAWNDQDTLTLTSSDKEMKSLQVPLVNGQASPSITLDKAITGATFTVSDHGSMTTTSTPFNIVGGPPVSGTLKVSPSTVTAGKSVTVTMSGAKDTYGNPASTPGLYINLAANDNPNEGLGQMQLTNGQGTASVTLTLVAQNIKEQAFYNGGLAGGKLVATSGVITVTPLGAVKLAVSSSPNAAAASPLSVTLTAQDQYGNTATNSGWDGKATVSFSTSNGEAVTAPATAQFKAGVATASVTFTQAGAASFMLNVSATRPPKHGSPTLTVSGFEWLTVGPGVVAKFIVVGPSLTSVGTPFPLTITAEDGGNNIVTTYNGSPQFSATPTQTVQSGGTSWSNGVGTASLTLEAAGSPTVTAYVFINEMVGNRLKRVKAQGTSQPINVGPDWFSSNVPDPGLQALAREDYFANGGYFIWNSPGDAGGSLSYNNWLGLFQQAETASTISATVLTSLQALATNAQLLGIPAGVANLANKVANGDPANGYYHPLSGGIAQNQTLGNLKAGDSATKLKKLVNKWFLGVDYPRSTTGNPGATTTPAYKLVNAPGAANPVPLWGPDESASHVNYYDIHQVSLADCWVLAPLAAVAQQDPAALYNMITDNGNGTYTIGFYNEGKKVTDYVTVDTELPNGGASFDYIKHVVPGDNGIAQFTNQTSQVAIADPAPAGAPYYFSELWAALVEKAYAQENAEGWLPSNDPGSDGYGAVGGIGYQAIHWISTDYAGTDKIIAAYTGHAATGYIPGTGSGQTAAATLGGYWQAGQPVVLGTPDTDNTVQTGVHVVEKHVYAVIGYDSSSGQFTLYNPWGLDGAGYTPDGETSGVFCSGVITADSSQVVSYFSFAASGSAAGLSHAMANVSGIPIAAGPSGGSLAAPGVAQRALLTQLPQPAAPLAAAATVNQLKALDAVLASRGIGEGHHKSALEGDKLSEDRIDALFAANDLPLATSLNP